MLSMISSVTISDGTQLSNLHTGFVVSAIVNVDDFGRLQLRMLDGEIKCYNFKEIRYVGAPNSFEGE